MRILIGQLSANGDNLYATALAHQIKVDYPDSELTWAISAPCRHLLTNNPHVDQVLELAVPGRARQQEAWDALEREWLRDCWGGGPGRGGYDRVILPQIWPNNFHRYDGTIRPSMMRAYGAPITVPITPVLRLTDEEIARVGDFVANHRIDDYKHRILIECAALSGQSNMTPEFGLALAHTITARLPDSCVLLSSHLPVNSGGNPAIIDASPLSMRQNAALTHHCTLFVGAGSGLTVVTTSTAAIRLPTLILLNGATSMYASFHHDLEYWGEATDHIIEMADATLAAATDCVLLIAGGAQDEAKRQFHWNVPISFGFYLSQIDQFLLQRNRFAAAAESLMLTTGRYGWHDDLESFARDRVLPHLDHDPALWLPARQEAMEQFRETVGRQGAPAHSTASNSAAASPYPPRDTVHQHLSSNHWHQMQIAVRQLMLNGRQASMLLRAQGPIDTLADAEFQVFSQWGEDGIIEWLVQNLPFRSKTFIEFGVEDYRESNTRFLLQHRNWRGLVIDGSEKNISRIRNEMFFWRHDLTAVNCFIDTKNINQIITENSFSGEIGILSIDIDGNDHWIWSVIDCVNPEVVICEYNAIFGDIYPVSTPYADTFNRFDHHHSGLHAGASIKALVGLAECKGYRLIGSNSNGLNAFFVRADLAARLDSVLRRRLAYPSLFRNSCAPDGKLTHVAGLDRAQLIENLPLVRTDDYTWTTLKALGPLYSADWLSRMTGHAVQGMQSE